MRFIEAISWPTSSLPAAWRDATSSPRASVSAMRTASWSGPERLFTISQAISAAASTALSGDAVGEVLAVGGGGDARVEHPLQGLRGVVPGADAGGEGALGGVLDALARRGGAGVAAVDDVARHAVGEGRRRRGVRLETVAGRGQLAAGVLRRGLGHAGAVVVDALPQRAELHQELHALLGVDGAIRRQRLDHLDDAVDVALVLDAVPDDRFHRVVGIEVRVEDQVRGVTDIREGVDDALNELLGAGRAILRAGAAGGLLPLVLQRRQALRRVEQRAVLRFGRVEDA